MEIKNFFKDNGFCIICMVVCFGLGFVLGALLAPHHNKLEFNLFSGNGNSNRDNSANFGSGGVQNGQKSVKRRSHKKCRDVSYRLCILCCRENKF